MHIEQSGIRMGRKRTDVIPADCAIRPLRDHIVVKPLDWEPSKILAELGAKIVYQGKTLRGEVLAVGPGCYPKRYNKDRSKSWDSTQFRPTEVKVGDVVELGGLEIRGYQFDELMWGNQRIVMCREADVTGIVT
jgi:co-chaperonin GroES (HSP10)